MKKTILPICLSAMFAAVAIAQLPNDTLLLTKAQTAQAVATSDTTITIDLGNGTIVHLTGNYTEAGEFLGIVSDVDTIKTVVTEIVDEVKNSPKPTSPFGWVALLLGILVKLAINGTLVSGIAIVSRSVKKLKVLFDKIPDNRALVLAIASIAAIVHVLVKQGFEALTIDTFASRFIVYYLAAELVYNLILSRFVKTPKVSITTVNTAKP